MNPGDTLDIISTLTDRELLEKIARDIQASRDLIANAIESFEPMLNSPKIKLLTKLF